MVKLTVLYNLPDGSNHDSYIKWRTGEHQAANASAPNVLKTDFYVATATPLGEPKYRYITEAYFATVEDLNASFFSEASQSKLKQDIKRIKDPVFLVSEEFASTDKTT